VRISGRSPRNLPVASNIARQGLRRREADVRKRPVDVMNLPGGAGQP
jgi:hypothetical protein